MKSIKTFVSALAILGLSSLVLASSTTDSAASAAKTTADAAKTAADAAKTASTAVASTAPAAKLEPVTGKVVSVDAAAKTFKVSYAKMGADGKATTSEAELNWVENTKLAWKNEKMTAATATDLKAGAEVTIKTENKDGKLVASEIWFHPAATTAQPAAK